MKKIPQFVLVCPYLLAAFLILCCEGCSSSAESTSMTDAAQSTVEATTDSLVSLNVNTPLKEILAVYNQEGKPDTLYLDENTAAVTMATWCPHSHEFLAMLNDSLVVTKLSGRELVFLFEKDELPTIFRQIDNEPNWSKSDKSRYRKAIVLKVKSRNGIQLFDRSMLDELPGEVYFYDEESGLHNDGFPSAYSGAGKEFTTNYAEWLFKNTELPMDEFKNLIVRHIKRENTIAQ